MEEQPAVAVRRKRDASINVCMRLVRDGEADAVVTAGHTGAGVASAILHLKRLPGVDRPALAVQMITDSGPLILLDIGATTDSTGVNLAQYAHMGSLFSERVLGVQEPTRRTALHRRGAGQGRAARPGRHSAPEGQSPALRRQRRGSGLPHHAADVVVCDASVGNVVMKFFEGLSTRHLRHDPRASSSARPGGPSATSSCVPGIGRIRARFDYEKLGGSPLLGRERHRPHHPWQRQAAHDRLRGRGDGPGGAGTHPRAHHGHARLGGRRPLHGAAPDGGAASGGGGATAAEGMPPPGPASGGRGRRRAD